MPGSFQTSAPGAVPNTRGLPVVRGFQSGDSSFFEYPYAITGITKDETGAVLPNCTLVLLRTSDNSVAALGTSDASGAYRLAASPSVTHRLDAYLAGSPDRAGSTVNTLVGE